MKSRLSFFTMVEIDIKKIFYNVYVTQLERYNTKNRNKYHTDILSFVLVMIFSELYSLFLTTMDNMEF